MTQTRNRPGVASGAASKTIAAVGPSVGQATTPRRYRVAYASAYGPSGRRKRCLIITGPCPFGCGGRHVHFVRELAGGARRAGCGRGTYWLAIARTYASKPQAVAV